MPTQRSNPRLADECLWICCSRVRPPTVAGKSLSVSCQISIEDTVPTQGALEIVPGTQNYDPRVSDRERLADPKYPPPPPPPVATLPYPCRTP